MKNKFSLLIFSLVLMFLLGSFAQVLACSCSESTPAEVYNYSDVVFVGKEIGATRRDSFTINGKTYNHESGDVTFEITESFVGAKKGTKIIINNDWAEMCGTVYERGEEYLIYARKDENGNLSAIMCSRITLSTYAKEDLEFFRNILPKAKGAIIFGSAKMFPGRLPFAQIKIEIQSNGGNRKIFTAKTDEKGDFSIEVPAGTYTLKPILPDNLIVETYPNKEIKLKVGGSQAFYVNVAKKDE